MSGCSYPHDQVFAVCPGCGELITPAAEQGTGAFEIFGEPPDFFVDLAKVQKRFYDISRRLHPDRFQHGSAENLAKATDWFARLNGALAVLKNDDDRAQALFNLAHFAPKNAKSSLPAELAEDYFSLQDTLEDMSLAAESRQRQVRQFKNFIELKIQEYDQNRDQAFREWQNSGKSLEAGAEEFFAKAALAMGQKAYLISMLHDLEKRCQT